MLSLFKKYATTDIELNHYNELEALKTLATIAAKKANQDEQLVKSGLLASIAQGEFSINGRVLTTNATITETHHIHIVVGTFANAVNWSGSSIDIAFIILTPAETDAAVIDQINQSIQSKLATQDLNELHGNTGALDKIVKAVKAEL